LRLLDSSRQRYSLIEQQATIALLLQNIKSDLDSHPLKMLHRLQDSHDFSWHSGKPNSLTIRDDALRPRAESQILSLVKVDLPQLLRVRRMERQTEKVLEIEACSVTSRRIDVVRKSYIAVNLDEAHELATNAYERLTPNCINLSLRIQDGMFSSGPAHEYYNFLLPIQSNYSIYQDQENRLRKVTHLATENTSNQTILPLSYPLKIELPSGTVDPFLNLKFIWTPKTRSDFVFETLSFIPRIDLASFALIQAASNL
jgi:hypothetical protein